MTPDPPPAAQRHPHLGLPCPPGWVRADMHAHTMWSGDSTTTPDELSRALAEGGVDVVFITDHNSIEGATRLQHELPCRVEVGEEVRTPRGEIIGLFLSERIPGGLPPMEVARRIRDQGGLVYIPHPFDPMRARLHPEALEQLLGEGMVDAVEVRNAKTSLEHLNRRASELASQHGLAMGAGSDAHVAEAVGAACVELPDFGGAASLLRSLSEARPIGHHFDPPRPWRPRIVPSFEG